MGLATQYAKTAPSTIEQNAVAAIKALTSAHIVANITSADGASSSQPVAFDMTMDSSGQCTGTFSASGSTLGVVLVGGKTYIKASGDFWSRNGAPASVLPKVADKWVSGLPVGNIGGVCNLADLTKGFTNGDVGKNAKLLGTAAVNGIPVVNLQVTSDKGKTNTVSVAATTPHNVIKVVSSDGKNQMTFSQINQPVTVTAPSGAVDSSTLK